MNEKDVARQKDVAESRKPRVLFVDLENTPSLVWAWEGYDATALEVEEDAKLLCFSYHASWIDNKIHNVALTDFPYKANRFKIDDRKVIYKLWDLFNEADIIIAQNGDRFDIRVANARFLHYGLPPPQEYKTIDTLKIARRYFKLIFNSLDHLCRFLGIERKVDAGGKGTWFRCMDGDKKSWKHMIYYNNADVDRLMKVYDKMKGWHKTQPIANLYTRKLNHCPNVTCMSTDYMLNGTRLLKTGWKQRINCNKCGTRWVTDLHREDPKIDITL